jgi:hypothetical protein
LKSRSVPYAACLVGGTLVGAILGNRIFPEAEAMFRDLIDVFFGLWGAFLAVIAYETAAMSLRPN